MMATCICRSSAMAKCPVWGRFGNSPGEHWGLGTGLWIVPHVHLATAPHYFWEQEEKCHSTVVQSYWKDKSGITRDIKNISTPNKKLKQYSFHIHHMCVSESDSFMQRCHWHIQSLKFKSNSQRGCSVESLPLYLESNLIFLLLGCELNYSMLQTLLL